ncbi:hypothetical protein [Krasilnikovia sp. M28-CT-15]|uniref:hypothetical protein n=1 Tax=Krasilnikovia sp. M28-CT-15 TaxID=3373540 RepID=UPI003876510E
MSIDRAATAVRGVPPERRGRFVSGLGQALAVWLVMVPIVLFVPNVAVAWTLFVAGLLACVVLGKRHRWQGRADSAIGAFTGAVLWPLIIGAAVIAIDIVSEYGSPYE